MSVEVAGIGIETRSPFAKESAVSLAVSGSTPKTVMSGRRCLAAVAEPAISPAPDTRELVNCSSSLTCAGVRALMIVNRRARAQMDLCM